MKKILIIISFLFTGCTKSELENYSTLSLIKDRTWTVVEDCNSLIMFEGTQWDNELFVHYISCGEYKKGSARIISEDIVFSEIRDLIGTWQVTNHEINGNKHFITIRSGDRSFDLWCLF